MAHSHSHAWDENAKRLMLAFGVTAVFMVVEVIGGIIGSLALLVDAGHMLTDAAALFFALLAVKFACRSPTSAIRLAGSGLQPLLPLLTRLHLVVITIFIVWEAFQRFRHPQPIAGMTMMVIAVAGLLANILAFWILHRGSGEKPERQGGGAGMYR